MIPIFLQLPVHQLEGQFPSCRVGHISPFQVADPIPAGQLHHFFSGLSRGIEKLEYAGQAVAPFRAGETAEILHMETAASALAL